MKRLITIKPAQVDAELAEVEKEMKKHRKALGIG